MDSALLLAAGSFGVLVALLFGVPALKHAMSDMQERNKQKKRQRKRKPPRSN